MSGLIDASAIALLDDGRRRYQPVKPLLRAFLGRSFPSRAQHKILFVHMDDPIAWPQVFPFFHYAERFAAMGYTFRTVPFPAEGAERLVKDATAIFVQSPYWPAEGEIERVLERLRRDNPDAPLSYLDWFAPTDVRFADRVGDYVHCYAKKALIRDRGYYRAPQSAQSTLADYYSKTFGLIPDAPTWQFRPDIADRLVLAPGFATAPSLLKGFDRATAPPRGARSIDVHARFALAPTALRDQGRVDAGERTHWYAAMRQHSRDAIAALSARHTIAWQGKVSRAEFMAEMERSQLCFSPFGFGELCWRDLEAILAGAVLVKHDMGHLDCLCDIYRPGETYVPVRWDLADLDETIADLLARPEECRAIAERAFAAVKDYLAGPKLGDFLARLANPAR